MTWQSLKHAIASADLLGRERYDSPIEEALGERLRTHVDRRCCRLLTQLDVPTQHTVRRLDLALLHTSGKVVGFEADGREFHQARRDALRDAEIFATSLVDVIYRIRGADIKRWLGDVLFVIARSDPEFFDRCAHARIEFGASEAIQTLSRRDSNGSTWLTRVDAHPLSAVGEFVVLRQLRSSWARDQNLESLNTGQAA